MRYWLIKNLLAIPLLHLFFTIEVHGRENLPRRGPGLIASNHLSTIDSVFVPLVIPRHVTYLAKSQFTNGRSLGAWFRRGALAFAREIERRTDDVTTAWWRKDRDPRKLFVDYNQNVRDHTIAAAYSVRGVPDATVSAPIRWDEVDDADPRDFTITTMPARFAELGDLHADIDGHVFDLRPLLEWAERDEAEGKETPAEPETD